MGSHGIVQEYSDVRLEKSIHILGIVTQKSVCYISELVKCVVTMCKLNVLGQ